MKDSETMEAYFCNVLEVVNQIRKYGDQLTEQKVIEKNIAEPS